MSEALLEAFRHNAWATRELLAFCRDLPAERLGAAGVGTYGDIVTTFDHLIRADAGYVSRLGPRIAWAVEREATADLAELERRADEAATAWERVLSEPVDTERVILVDQGAREVRAGIFVAQALNHGNVHREQICSILTGLGIEPPDLQAWAYADATGRMWETNPAG